MKTPEVWKKLHEAHKAAGVHGEEVTIGALDWDPRRWCSLCREASRQTGPTPASRVTALAFLNRQGHKVSMYSPEESGHPGWVIFVLGSKLSKDEVDMVRVILEGKR